MHATLLLVTLTCSPGFDALPAATLTAPLVCGAWGDKMGKKGDPTPLDRLLGLFRRKQAADFPVATHDWVAPANAAAPAGAFPTGVPYNGYQAVPGNAVPQGVQAPYYYPSPGN